MRWAAAIVAAGRGTRFGRPKQFLELAGLPMVGWSIRTFARMPEIEEIVIATEPESIETMQGLAERVAPGRVRAVVAGGASRQGSVYNAVRAVSARCDAVFVHDGARPLVRDDDVRAGMAEVREGRAALLAAPAIDTVKVVDAATRCVRQTLDRATLWAAQTPQFAMTSDLLRAHERAREAGIEATDDAALLEAMGIDVVVVPSSTENFKVTLPEDVARAEAFLRERPSTSLRMTQ
jgi:2-C-methyl-D-erythritol 4-phosphate cytidylyltransferase